MITTEYIEGYGTEFRHTASDTFLIRKVGTDEVYDEAVDVLTAAWEYEETNIPLLQPEEEELT